MPGLCGSELQVRCARERPSLPVIVISAFTDPETERRTIENGAVAYLHKPFDGEALLALVHRVLGDASAGASVRAGGPHRGGGGVDQWRGGGLLW